MKTSIFDMNFTLPPMVEMVKEEKEMPRAKYRTQGRYLGWRC